MRFFFFFFILEYLQTHYPKEFWTHGYTDGSAENAVRNGGAGVYIQYPGGKEDKIRQQNIYCSPCPIYEPLRKGIWPDHTPVTRKPYGSLRDLRCAATFIEETGVSIWKCPQSLVTSTPYPLLSYMTVWMEVFLM